MKVVFSLAETKHNQTFYGNVHLIELVGCSDVAEICEGLHPVEFLMLRCCQATIAPLNHGQIPIFLAGNGSLVALKFVSSMSWNVPDPHLPPNNHQIKPLKPILGLDHRNNQDASACVNR